MRHNFKISDVPNTPGVYVFRNRCGEIIYVGKAVNLRKRVVQYFRKSGTAFADPKFRSLVNSIDSWEFFKTDGENEAILLESKLIKEYLPRYNILMRDDKRFLLLKINPDEKYPMIRLVRLKKNDGADYFGPFPKSGALRETVEFLTTQFGIKVCGAPDPGVKEFHRCVAGAADKCSAPCAGKISKQKYRRQMNSLISVLRGKTEEISGQLREKMRREAGQKNFEKAAKSRDIIENVQCLLRRGKQTAGIYTSKKTGADSIKELKKELGLEKMPRRIEAFDVSNISGTLAVAGMVSFLDGHPDKKKYRRFKIKKSNIADDFAMIKEAVSRRCLRLIKEGKKIPDLIIIDGGKGQLSAAIEALNAAGLYRVPILGLAKKREEIFVADRKLPIILDVHSPTLKLLQAIRDEAHRFSLTYHQKIRDSRIEDSVLDEIYGIGRKRKIMLLKEFGSIKNLKKCGEAELIKRVPAIGAKFARTITKFLSNPKQKLN
jgi:excinuclease ABC subunit C